MITPQLVAEILGLAAIAVPITQAVKKWLHAEGKTALIISAIVTILLALWRSRSLLYLLLAYFWSRTVFIISGRMLSARW